MTSYYQETRSGSEEVPLKMKPAGLISTLLRWPSLTLFNHRTFCAHSVFFASFLRECTQTRGIWYWKLSLPIYLQSFVLVTQIFSRVPMTKSFEPFCGEINENLKDFRFPSVLLRPTTVENINMFSYTSMYEYTMSYSLSLTCSTAIYLLLDMSGDQLIISFAGCLWLWVVDVKMKVSSDSTENLGRAF